MELGFCDFDEFALVGSRLCSSDEKSVDLSR